MTMTPSITQSAEPEPTLSMLLFAESSGDALFTGPASTDIATYMAGSPNGQWFGWTFGGEPDLTNANVLADFLYWMDWPGFQTGTANSIATISVNVPQTAGGTDTYGNNIEQYKFVTTEIPAGSFTVGDNIQFAFIVPHSLLSNSTKIYSTIGYNYTNTPSDAVSDTTGTSAYRVTDVNYTGSVWNNTTYRVFTNAGTLNRNISVGDNSNNFYFRGGDII
jgi:hypothetical protein